MNATPAMPEIHAVARMVSSPNQSQRGPFLQRVFQAAEEHRHQRHAEVIGAAQQ